MLSYIDIDLGIPVLLISAYLALAFAAIEGLFGYRLMKGGRVVHGFLTGAAVGSALGILLDDLIIGMATIILLGILLAILSYISFRFSACVFTALMGYAALHLTVGNVYIALGIALAAGILAAFFPKPVVIVTFPVAAAKIMLDCFTYASGIKLDLIITIAILVALSAVGVLCQFLTARKINHTKPSALPYKEFNELLSDEPILQPAYRNYCIKCGAKMPGSDSECAVCGFKF